MIKTNKISNLNRLNLRNKWIVFFYLIKRLLKIKQNQKEQKVYVFYNFLINSKGYLIEETQNAYVVNFKNNFFKRIKLRKRPSSDIDVFQQIYREQEYLHVVNAYNDNFSQKKDSCLNIIDAGANIGLTTLFFLKIFDRANIVCVEPEIKNFKILEFNLDNNSNCKIVKVYGAVWSSNSQIEIVNDFRDKSDWSFRVEETNNNNAISAYSINQLVKENGFKYIDILKMDVEGSEKQIFTSELSNLDFLKITKCIAIEIHDEFNCRQDIYNVLSNYGFTYFNHGELTIGINQKLSHL